jgi:hypothetical protein
MQLFCRFLPMINILVTSHGYLEIVRDYLLISLFVNFFQIFSNCFFFFHILEVMLALHALFKILEQWMSHVSSTAEKIFSKFFQTQESARTSSLFLILNLLATNTAEIFTYLQIHIYFHIFVREILVINWDTLFCIQLNIFVLVIKWSFQ